MWPHRQQPTRFPHPWDSPGKNTGVGCHFLLQCVKVKSESEVTQSCPTLSDPMDRSPPGSAILGIFQARVLEWGAIAFSSPLAWKIPWMEEPGGLRSMGSLRVGHDWATPLSLFLSCIGEGNGNPLQCSCLENPRDGGAWWAAVYGVAQSRTRLKRLSSSSSDSELGLAPAGVPIDPGDRALGRKREIVFIFYFYLQYLLFQRDLFFHDPYITVLSISI